MPKISEETTKGLVAEKLKELDGYPTSQNTMLNDIIWFKEDSYKGTSYNWLSDVFAKATKKQTLRSRGTPDYLVAKTDSNVIIAIECKGSEEKHMILDNPIDYKTHGYGSPDETEKYAVNGALWYASFLCEKYDVVAIGVSGQTKTDCRVTSFVWPKGGDITDIEVLEDGYLDNALTSINDYEKDVEIVLDRFSATEEQVRKELRRYTLQCANFLRSNGIEDNSKAGFVSAIVLGLTNHESKLYKDTKSAIDKKKSSRSKSMGSDSIGKNAIKMLKASLYGDGNEYDEDYIKGVWDIDGIPKGKRTSLRKFYDGLLVKDELTRAPKGKNKYFSDGDTVLSCCIYSLYENVIEILEHYSGIDVMGEFYTTFLRFTKGNAKEKGIVLTPKHITELFCDIAEFYYDKKFDEKVKVIDICCGTGSFLISALNRIKDNIGSKRLSESAKKEKYNIAQMNSLIGVEKDASMFALAYANMRFHGDGKSNLFNCSSLLVDSYAPVDDGGKTYIADKKVALHEALKEFGDIDIGMINPPYSLDKKDDSANQEYPIVKELNELEESNKIHRKKIKELKKKSKDGSNDSEIIRIEKEIKKNNQKIERIEEEYDKSGLREITFQKGQDELDFIASMLHYLKVGGIGVAIVPMSCAGNIGTKLRKELLKYHTLLACMTMPPALFFDSHVGTATCIMVFKAHIPHDSNKASFLARWNDDGFKVIPHNGRKDIGEWDNKRTEWMEQLDGVASQNKRVWLKRKLEIDDEALAEAYVETDYAALSDKDFEKVLKKYSLFKYMEENGLLEE